MLKVMTIVGTRPELIKMSRVIAELDQYTEHVLVHTGQNFDYELNQVFFDDLAIRKPDHFLAAVGENPAQTISRVIEKSDAVFELEKPQALMLYGDTNSCLAIIAAKRRKIPVFHMEAGNRCFDQRVPEELNRKVVDHLADVNMVLTEHARRYLLAEGLPADRIFKTGSHMAEVLAHYADQIDRSEALVKLGLQSRNFLLVSAHREENVDSPENLNDLLSSLDALVNEFKMPVIVSTHPRTRIRLEQNPQFRSSPAIRFLKPFGFFDYVKLQKEAFCVLSDSGTITEEASLLGLRAVTIRNAHERPEGMDDGVLIMSGLKPDSVLHAVRVVTAVDAHAQKSSVADYRGGSVSKKVLNIVLSYTSFINRVVWHKT